MNGRVWRSIDDYSDGDIAWIMDRAARHRAGNAMSLCAGAVVGLLFLETSLRTRLGFAAAAARLGAQPLMIWEQRHSLISAHESVQDTLEIMGGYCDLVVARLDRPLAESLPAAGTRCPVLNGGDRGIACEHPSQAVVDWFALTSEYGGVRGKTVAVVGDPRMRAAASLFRLLARHQPARVVAVTRPALLDGFATPTGVEVVDSWSDTGRIDVLYAVGIPHRSVPESDRAALRVTPAVLSCLTSNGVVMSPLPLIDEVSAAARADSRFRAFTHSHDGLFARMAIIEFSCSAAAGRPIVART
jgi:aspartate carbamoyltransferase catalytic subunit